MSTTFDLSELNVLVEELRQKQAREFEESYVRSLTDEQRIQREKDDIEFEATKLRKSEIITELLEPVAGIAKPDHPFMSWRENLYDEMVEREEEGRKHWMTRKGKYDYVKSAWKEQKEKRQKILYNDLARGTPFFDLKFEEEQEALEGGIDVNEVEIEGIDYLIDESTGIYYVADAEEPIETLPKKKVFNPQSNKDKRVPKYRLETDAEVEERLAKTKALDLQAVNKFLIEHATDIYGRIEEDFQEKKEAEKARIEAERELQREKEAEAEVEKQKFRRKMVLKSRGTTEKEEMEKKRKLEEEEDAERARFNEERRKREFEELQKLDARITARNAAIAKLEREEEEDLRTLPVELEEETDEETDEEETDTDDRFGGQETRWEIFTRAKKWTPYPPARAKKGEKGRAEYKKEGKVGFFDDFPEVPYWQGQLGLELYMDKVDIYVGKKKKRKKVAKDRLTDRLYMYNPETQMYEEQIQTDGFPTAQKKPLNKKIFESKICLAEQQGLSNIYAEYDAEKFKGFDYYVEEDHYDIYDCNCNHLGKFDSWKGELVGQANRYDWSKSDMDKAMFISREQINLILLQYYTLDTPDGDRETLAEYEKEFAEGLKEKILVGNEISFMTIMSIHPNFEDTGGLGEMGENIKLVDIRTEEEKSIPIWDFTDIVLPDMKGGAKPAKPPVKEKPKLTEKQTASLGEKPKKPKKPRTQAQLDALAVARARLAKKKAEQKKSEE